MQIGRWQIMYVQELKIGEVHKSDKFLINKKTSSAQLFKQSIKLLIHLSWFNLLENALCSVGFTNNTFRVGLLRNFLRWLAMFCVIKCMSGDLGNQIGITGKYLNPNTIYKIELFKITSAFFIKQKSVTQIS